MANRNKRRGERSVEERIEDMNKARSALDESVQKNGMFDLETIDRVMTVCEESGIQPPGFLKKIYGLFTSAELMVGMASGGTLKVKEIINGENPDAVKASVNSWIDGISKMTGWTLETSGGLLGNITTMLGNGIQGVAGEGAASPFASFLKDVLPKDGVLKVADDLRNTISNAKMKDDTGEAYSHARNRERKEQENVENVPGEAGGGQSGSNQRRSSQNHR